MARPSAEVWIQLEDGITEQAIEQVFHIYGGLRTAAARAVNRTLSKGRTQIRRAIVKRYVVNNRAVANSLHIIKARANAHGDDFFDGAIEARGGPQSLMNFQVYPKSVASRRPRIGARVKVLRQGSRKVIPHSFVAMMPWHSGAVKEGVFIRVSGGSIIKSGQYGGRKIVRRFGRGRGLENFVGPRLHSGGQFGLVSRLPIVELRGPGFFSMFRKVAPPLKPALQAELQERFQHEVRYLINQAERGK